MSEASGLFSDRAIAIVVDDKIRAAIQAGEFDHLPGLGKPHPIFSEPFDPDMWARRKMVRERLGGSK